MSGIYKWSPLIVVIFGYLLWMNSRYNTPLVLFLNGLIVLIFSALVALPVAWVMFKRQKVKMTKAALNSLDQADNTENAFGFYHYFSRCVFYVGCASCLLVLFMRL